jgi:hypothetical protein
MKPHSQELARRSKPVIAAQQLANWIHRESRPNAEEEIAELRSEVPQRWLRELRSIIQEDAGTVHLPGNDKGPPRAAWDSPSNALSSL